MQEKSKEPEIRFAGFTGAWEQRKLGALLDEYKVSIPTPHDGYTRLGIRSHAKGTFHEYVPKGRELETKEMNKVAKDKLILNITFAWEHAVAITDEKDEGALVSHRFPQFTLHPEIIPNFLKYVILDESFRHHLYLASPGGAGRNRVLKISQMLEYAIKYPSTAEQLRISNLLDSINSLITLHQRKYEKLLNIKKSMLEKMFPKEGEVVPEIRFKGFTGAWEQRKFSKLVLIERGGSPRPIDNYITNKSNGINWVKIGDAPKEGRYITKTAEKIRPEGVNKSREVFPGDLILSNSMSFGKPYIMGIRGCIHDGWLLIRDTNKIFDPIFLCYLLGTDQMLAQYKALASGSTVNNLNKELVGNTHISLPGKEEQHVIGEFLQGLDSLLTLHQRKLEMLKNVKQAFLEKMFV